MEVAQDQLWMMQTSEIKLETTPIVDHLVVFGWGPKKQKKYRRQQLIITMGQHINSGFTNRWASQSAPLSHTFIHATPTPLAPLSFAPHHMTQC